eukprot:g76053.t1
MPTIAQEPTPSIAQEPTPKSSPDFTSLFVGDPLTKSPDLLASPLTKSRFSMSSITEELPPKSTPYFTSLSLLDPLNKSPDVLGSPLTKSSDLLGSPLTKSPHLLVLPSADTPSWTLLPRRQVGQRTMDIPLSLEQGKRKIDIPLSIEQGNRSIASPYSVQQGNMNIDIPLSVEQGNRNISSPFSIAQGNRKIDIPLSIEQDKRSIAERSISIPLSVEQGNRNISSPFSIEKCNRNISIPLSIEQNNRNLASPLSIECNRSITETSISVPLSVEQGRRSISAPYSVEQGKRSIPSLDNSFSLANPLATAMEILAQKSIDGLTDKHSKQAQVHFSRRKARNMSGSSELNSPTASPMPALRTPLSSITAARAAEFLQEMQEIKTGKPRRSPVFFASKDAGADTTSSQNGPSALDSASRVQVERGRQLQEAMKERSLAKINSVLEPTLAAGHQSRTTRMALNLKEELEEEDKVLKSLQRFVDTYNIPAIKAVLKEAADMKMDHPLVLEAACIAFTLTKEELFGARVAAAERQRDEKALEKLIEAGPQQAVAVEEDDEEGVADHLEPSWEQPRNSQPSHHISNSYLKFIALKGKYSLRDFPSLHTAEEYVRPVWFRWNRDEALRRQLVWQRGRISNSLTRINADMCDGSSKKAAQLRQVACEMFEKLRGYMGELPARYPVPRAYEFIQMAVLEARLRDEAFCQLIKQTTHNPSPDSLLLGWKLFFLCISTFWPSDLLRPVVLSYLAAHAPPTLPEQGEPSRPVFATVADLACHCFKAIDVKSPPVLEAPSLNDIEKLTNNTLAAVLSYYSYNESTVRPSLVSSNEVPPLRMSVSSFRSAHSAYPVVAAKPPRPARLGQATMGNTHTTNTESHPSAAIIAAKIQKMKQVMPQLSDEACRQALSENDWRWGNALEALLSQDEGFARPSSLEMQAQRQGGSSARAVSLEMHTLNNPYRSEHLSSSGSSAIRGDRRKKKPGRPKTYGKKTAHP